MLNFEDVEERDGRLSCCTVRRMLDDFRRRASFLERLAVLQNRGDANGRPYISSLYPLDLEGRPAACLIRTCDVQTPMSCGSQSLLVRDLTCSSPSKCNMSVTAKSISGESFGSVRSVCNVTHSLRITRISPTPTCPRSFSRSTPPSSTRSHVQPRSHRSFFS